MFKFLSNEKNTTTLYSTRFLPEVCSRSSLLFSRTAKIHPVLRNKHYPINLNWLYGSMPATIQLCDCIDLMFVLRLTWLHP